MGEHQPTVDELAARVREARKDLTEKAILYHIGKLPYDDLANAAKQMSNLFYGYQVAKYPQKKHRRLSYQTIIRNAKW